MNAFDLPRSSRRSSSFPRAQREIALRYPASWFTMVNPSAATVERRTAAWLEEASVITDEDGRLRLRTTQGGAGEAGLAAVLAGAPDAPCAGDPCLRAFHEIARRYRGTMSERWLDRHAARYLEWIRAVRCEAPVALRHQAAKSLPTVEQYLRLRQMTIGVLPTLSFIEYVTEQELPDEVRSLPTFQAIERMAAEIVAIPNDLFGYSQDRRMCWVNAVSCMAAEKSVSTADAMALCAELHNRRVGEMVRLEASLLAQVKDQPRVEEWLRKLHHLIHGFTRWHDGAPRYRRVHQLEGGARIQLVVRYT